MATAPRRTAAPAPARRAGTRPSATAESTVKSSYRGAAGLRQMQEEQVKAEAKKAAREASFGAPFRYWTPIKATQEIIIVDEAPDFFRHEHALQNRASKKWDNYAPCIDENANCPVCAVAERPSYFAMYLTIVDLTPYINKDGDEVEFTKKLLVVKPTQQKKIMRLYEKYKTLRGMILSMTRDDKESATIGNDIEFVEFMDEEELLAYETDYTDKEGKVHPVICHEVYDYDQLFPEMTEKALRAIAGGRPAEQGSRESTNAALQDDWEEPAARGTRTATRRGAAPAVEQEEEEVAAPAPRRSARQAPEPEPAPARAAGATRRAAAPPVEEEQEEDEAPAPVARRGRAAPAPVEEKQEEGPPFDADDVDDAPPPRRAAPRGRAAPAAEPEEAPQRSSVAARRASLRR